MPGETAGSQFPWCIFIKSKPDSVDINYYGNGSIFLYQIYMKSSGFHFSFQNLPLVSGKLNVRGRFQRDRNQILLQKDVVLYSFFLMVVFDVDFPRNRMLK